MQFSQIYHSITNVKIYKCLPHTFDLALTVSELWKLKKKYLQKVGQGHRVQISQSHHSMANVKIYKRHFYIFDFE